MSANDVNGLAADGRTFTVLDDTEEAADQDADAGEGDGGEDRAPVRNLVLAPGPVAAPTERKILVVDLDVPAMYTVRLVPNWENGRCGKDLHLPPEPKQEAREQAVRRQLNRETGKCNLCNAEEPGVS